MGKSKMKKLIYMTALLILGVSNAQDFGRSSLFMNYGNNLYVSTLGTSQLSPIVNIGYRYNITPTFGLQLLGQYDMYRSKADAHEDCLYKANSLAYRLEMVKRIVRFGRIGVLGSAGLGHTKMYLVDEGSDITFNYSTGVNLLYRLGSKREAWGAINLGYGVVTHSNQDVTLNRRFKPTSSGINSYTHNMSAGLTFYLDNNSKRKPADWWTEKKKCCEKEIIQPITVNPVQIVEKKEITNNKPVETVFFDYDKANIKIQARNAIYKVSQFLKQNPQYRVNVTGWACASGSPEYNLGLSKRRAEAVAVTLISLGIDKDRIFHEGKGIDYDYVTELNHTYPRRVELTLFE